MFVLSLLDCGPLPTPDYGSVDTSSGTTFGETASYVCNDGYDLIGVATRSCLENGTWSEFVPTCSIKGERYKEWCYFRHISRETNFANACQKST